MVVDTPASGATVENTVAAAVVVAAVGVIVIAFVGA